MATFSRAEILAGLHRLGELMDYKARFYSPYINHSRSVQPDTIIPDPVRRRGIGYIPKNGFDSFPPSPLH